MNKNLFITMFFLLIGSLTTLFAQKIDVKGTVSDTSGAPLAGVNVIVKGQKIGTATDFDGIYQILIQKETILVFSYVGFKSKEVVVSSPILNVRLEEDSNQLNDVVVTALGIKKEKKSLGYAVQAVQSKELLEGNSNSMVNGLQGKVSGVTVVNSGGAPGASAVIMIRGGSSITGNNQPLFVVDGIPIDNSTTSSLEVSSSNRASDINPEDIESISVLKGPAAAALYGIQAAEGAIIITTKRGKVGVSTISYSGSMSVNRVLGTVSVQDIYGHGTQIVGQDNTVVDPESPFSWGNKITGKTYNNIDNFFNSAISKNHTLSYSAGSEKATVYFSVGDASQEGIIDGTSHDKTSFKINVNSDVTKKLSLGLSANYINVNTESTKQGNSSGSSFRSLLAYPSDVNMEDFKNADNSQKEFYLDQQVDNPYWSIGNSPNSSEINRLLGVISLSYSILENLNLSYKLGIDNYTEFNKRITGTGSLLENREDGYISQFEKDHKRLNSTLLLSYNKDISDDFNVSTMVGNSVEEIDIRTTYSRGDGFQAPAIYSIGNVKSEDQSIDELISRKRIVGVFGELKFNWKNALFLTATGRNDWSSTLPKDKRSFFYPSVGLSGVVTDLLKKFGNDITSEKGLTYLKFRTTWAKVGKDAPIGALESSLSTNINSLASSGYTWNGVNVGNPNLEPEFTKSFEVGMDARWFKNRVGLDLTYYTSKSENQILRDIRVPPTTGTFYATLNGGSITNKGVEALLQLKVLPFSSKFKWNVDLNFGMNESTVNDLPGFLNEVYLSDSWTFNSTAAGAAILDGSLFGLRGKQPKLNGQGEVFIGSNGLPTLVDTTYENVNRMPDWTLGFSNTFAYENFKLSFLLDIVQGVDVYNATESALVFYGLSEHTIGREETVVLPGVDANGLKNTISVTMDQAFYQDYYSRNSQNFIEDGSFARLRYVTFSYNFPETILSKIHLESLQLFVIGRNLFTITDYSGVDPEVNTFGAGIAGAGSMSIDNLGTPNTQGVDLGIKVRF